METDAAIIKEAAAAQILSTLTTDPASPLDPAECSPVATAPTVTPKCVYVSKQDVFVQALQSLSLEMHETWVGAVGNDQVIGSVCIDVPPHAQFLTMHQQKFFGDYKLTEKDALESAKLAALLYLQKNGIITVDDINFSELAKCEGKLADCQQKLLAASWWATTFQERTESLQVDLRLPREENTRLIHASKGTDVKKEEPNLQDFSVKTEPSTLAASSSMDTSSTPPTLTHQINDSPLQLKKEHNPRNTKVRSVLFGPNSTGGSNTEDIDNKRVAPIPPCLPVTNKFEGVSSSERNMHVQSHECEDFVVPKKTKKFPRLRRKVYTSLPTVSIAQAVINRKRRGLIINSERSALKGLALHNFFHVKYMPLPICTSYIMIISPELLLKNSTNEEGNLKTKQIKDDGAADEDEIVL